MNRKIKWELKLNAKLAKCFLRYKYQIRQVKLFGIAVL